MLQDPVQIDSALVLFLQIASGLFWTITYILILRRGFKEKVYGMPMVALCANIAWEFIFSFIYPHTKPQLYIDYLWLLFDVGIVMQYLMYGPKEFPDRLPRVFFYVTFLFTLLYSGLTITLISHEFNEYVGIYAAFAQNLMMSALFISMLRKRNSTAGQSLYIAMSKMIGTLFPSLLFYLYYPQSYLLILLYIGIFILDTVYTLLLYYKMKEEGVSPWRKV